MKKSLFLCLICSTFVLSTGALAISSSANSTNKMNPAVGFNTLFLFQNSKKNTSNDGFGLQEAELILSSDVDAYWRAFTTLSIANDGSGGFTFGPEVAFIESLMIPNLTVKLGRFYTAWGKENPTHTHALAFMNKSYLLQRSLGEDGYSDYGFDLSTLLPFSWFSELKVQLLQGNNPDIFSTNSDNHKLAYLARLDNLWELSDSSTIELGMSDLFYRGHTGNSSLQTKSDLYNIDLTFKWRPVRKSLYHSFKWSTEYTNKRVAGALNQKFEGVSTYIQQQLTQRIYIGYRYEYIGKDKYANVSKERVHMANLAFRYSEFSVMRLQYEDVDDGSSTNERKVSFQFNYSIGAHPAHNY